MSGASAALFSPWCVTTGIASSSPRSWIAVTVATSDESTITLKLRVLKRRSRTSSAKNTPAIGALKIAATPPAAPAAASSRIVWSLSRKARPASEPNAAPRKTTGPWRPTAPPEPIVSAERSRRRSRS